MQFQLVQINSKLNSNPYDYLYIQDKLIWVDNYSEVLECILYRISKVTAAVYFRFSWQKGLLLSDSLYFLMLNVHQCTNHVTTTPPHIINNGLIYMLSRNHQYHRWNPQSLILTQCQLVITLKLTTNRSGLQCLWVWVVLFSLSSL